MSDIAPCPFCGSAPEFITDGRHEELRCVSDNCTADYVQRWNDPAVAMHRLRHIDKYLAITENLSAFCDWLRENPYPEMSWRKEQ